MKRLRPVASAMFAGIPLLAILMSCSQLPPKPQGLSDTQVRQLAIRYRDGWLAKSASEDAPVLSRSTIVSIEKTPEGWRVTFMTSTGHGPTTPEGMHDYYLHVYLRASGELGRIVRGPDVLS